MSTCTVLLTTYPAPYRRPTWSSFVTTEDRFSPRAVHIGYGADLLHSRGSHIPVKSHSSILHCVSTAVSALAITSQARYSYEQRYALCELTVTGLWADRDRTVSEPWSDCELTVIGLCVDCDRTVSWPWSDCELTVIGLWVDRDRTVSGPWSGCELTVIGLCVECDRTVSVPWWDRELTVIRLCVDCYRTVSWTWSDCDWTISRP